MKISVKTLKWIINKRYVCTRNRTYFFEPTSGYLVSWITKGFRDFRVILTRDQVCLMLKDDEGAPLAAALYQKINIRGLV